MSYQKLFGALVAIVMMGSTISAIPFLTENQSDSYDAANATDELVLSAGKTGSGMTTLGIPGLATDSSDEILVGFSNEYDVGDLNGDGVLSTWIWWSDYTYMANGVDNDGDGCVDEQAGAPGCDWTPDALIIVDSTSVSAYPNPLIEGTLMAWSYGAICYVYRIFVSPGIFPFAIRGVVDVLAIRNEFIAYQSVEAVAGVDVNGDGDSDPFVGHIDSRGFPARPPINHPAYTGSAAVTEPASPYSPISRRVFNGEAYAFSQGEHYDNADYNGDGDKTDFVVAYYEIDLITGGSLSKVNLGVQGWKARIDGETIGWDAKEEFDDRDWNNDADKKDRIVLYHNINTGFTGLVADELDPLIGAMVVTETVGAQERDRIVWSKRLGPSKEGRPASASDPLVRLFKMPHKTFYAKIEDEDSDPYTPLPKYKVKGIALPMDTWNGAILIRFQNGDARLWSLSENRYADAWPQPGRQLGICQLEPSGQCTWQWIYPHMGGDATIVVPLGTPAPSVGYVIFKN